ncbi:MAG: ketoacyl-ACP synthase III [Spirochaetales bacterium]
MPVNKTDCELYVLGMGHFHPGNVIDNAFLTSLDIGTNDEWITERTGIQRRRTVLSLDYITSTKNVDPRASGAASLFTNAQTGAAAAKMALARAGLQPSDIGLVISGGCSPQHTIPAEACSIAAELGIEAPGYDINSACSSFAAQLNALRNTKPETLPDYILVVNAENTTRTVDYNDRSTAVLWGDGTAATIVSPRKQGRFGVKWTTLVSDPSGWDKVSIPTGGFFQQNGSAVQTFGIRKSGEMLKALREHVGPEHYYIGHQANLLMLQSICDRAGIPAERHLYNVHEFGNCGAAGAPSVLSQNWDRFASGDEIALVVVGSGLTWGGVALQVL